MPGDFIEVRSATEILATLNEDGALEGLPFMPEMLPFCGGRFRVYRRAHKTCDTIEWTGLRGMDRVVHLDMLRCDGSAHGGCQAGCLFFWKEAWLKPLDAHTSERGDAAGHVPAIDSAADAWLRERAATDGAARYRCQATELHRATYPLSVFAPKQYACDVRANGATWWQVLSAIAVSTYNRFLRAMNRPAYPRTVGRLVKTPCEQLGLQAGEWVEVKSHAEILATLDAQGKNRGLTFDPEMVPYCGQRFRVLRRVSKLIDEKTGELRSIPGDCIILDGVVCRALYHRLCPRSTYPYWREIWLRRVEAGDAPRRSER